MLSETLFHLHRLLALHPFPASHQVSPVGCRCTVSIRAIPTSGRRLEPLEANPAAENNRRRRPQSACSLAGLGDRRLDALGPSSVLSAWRGLHRQASRLIGVDPLSPGTGLEDRETETGPSPFRHQLVGNDEGIRAGLSPARSIQPLDSSLLRLAWPGGRMKTAP